MTADILDALNWLAAADYPPSPSADVAKRAAAEIVRLRGEVSKWQGLAEAGVALAESQHRREQRVAARESIAPAEAKGDAFADWLAREMPPGTVISNPLWWAPRILRAIERTTPQPAGGDAVAEWQVWHKEDGWGATHPDNVAEYRARGVPVRPLYAHPPAPVQAAPQEGEKAAATLRDALKYVGYRQDGDLSTLAERAELWMRESRVLIDSQRANIDRLKAAHPSACELVVDEAMFARLALAYMERHDVLQICWGDMAGLSQEDGTAALQHRGDSRGGETA